MRMTQTTLEDRIDTHPCGGATVIVGVAGKAWPGVQYDGDEKYREHKKVGVVKPREVVENVLAHPCFLQTSVGQLAILTR